MTAAEARERKSELGHLNAFISLTSESGDGPAVAVKDNIHVRGTVTTGGGGILPAIVDADDAAVISAIRAAGCHVIGKTNLTEWAMGPTIENPTWGAVLNVRDESRVPGGSSSGSAVAVAAGLCDWAIGTDSGGSIRVPASLCGVVGFKPTTGIVSTEGVIPVSTTFDTVGPLARDVPTVTGAFAAMTGGRRPLPSSRDLRCFRVAIPAGWVADLDTETARVWATVSADFPEISFPTIDELSSRWNPIGLAEVGSVHRQWINEYADTYSEAVLRRMQAGCEILAVDYIAAHTDVARLRGEAETALHEVDALIVPTTPRVAPRIGAPDLLGLTRFVRPFNVTGQPAVSIPAPVEGLPVGIQLVGKLGDDRLLLEIAAALEESMRAAAAFANGASGL